MKDKSTKYEVKCMNCANVETINSVVNDMALITLRVVQEKEWAMSHYKNGCFICCPDCYPLAFDTSIGSVGKLKPDFKKKFSGKSVQVRAKDDRQ